MVLLGVQKYPKTAGQGFARQGSGAAWRGKNKDPSRLKLASNIGVFLPRHPRHNHLPHNSKAGMVDSYFK